MVYLEDAGLQYCTKLRSLVLRGSCSYRWNPFDEDFADGVFSWVPLVLPTLRCPELSYIALACVVRTARDIKHLMNNLRVIDNILATQVFNQLDEVSFSFETLSAEDVPPVIDLVWKNMPQTAEKNLLSLYDRWDQQ